MDWLLATPQIQSAFSSLGSLEGGTYVVNPNALSILEEIIYKLTYEDQTLRTFRRAIGFGQNVRSDLIPLLENASDNAILDAVIRILVNLTVPVECLFSVDVMYRTEVGRHTIFELNKLLYTSKEAFTDPKSTKSVIEYMKHILESDHKLSPHNCDQINNCLLLLRNILHIPENNANFIMPTTLSPGSRSVSMQNTILWNLFIQSIDKLLLYLMSCPQRAFWGVTMVQLIALIYKDQHVTTLQKLLNVWFEASLPESSEDNESNTSSPNQDSGESSPMLTSDPTSDSSDNGSGMCKKECTSEERHQLLREETEATLQEVSRKGQVYHDAMLRAESSEANSEMSTAECDESTSLKNCSVSYNVNKIDVKTMEAVENEEVSIQRNENQNKNQNQNQKQQHKQDIPQPAKYTINTTNSQSQTEVQFKPPIAMPIKMAKISAKSAFKYTNEFVDNDNSKPPQKFPHSGQLNLIKGKSCPQKRECPSSQSELSDCGYGTQLDNQESISTSSNDDDGPQSKPQHQKPPCNSKARTKQRAVMTIIDNKELRRKKLVKRSKSSLINMKGLALHTPLDEDISNLLKEFTVDFLLKGFGFLVEDLHSQLLTHMKVPIDTSHFFWLLTYFLKFAVQLELDMEHIYSILNYDVLSYLTYEGVTMSEQLELSVQQEGSDIKPYLRRIHLVVTAIREFLQAIETYKKVAHLTEDDRKRLQCLQVQISSTKDLRSMFILLIRRFNPNLHTKQYLQDLVVTNHILLLILDSVSKSDESFHFNMIEHISQFATLDIMHYYGMLLEDFKSNGQFINDCIFTMMHHIGGDLGHIGTLFQPLILKTYSRIWETDFGLCDDWSDLIEYVIHTFMKTPQKSKLALPNSTLTELIKEYNSENTDCTWTQEEKDTLYWYYVQSKTNSDIAGQITNLFKNNGNKHKPRVSIIQQLLQQDFISLVEYDDLMKFEDFEYQRSLLTTPTSATTESGFGSKESAPCDKPGDDIQILRDLILRDNKQKYIVWLQMLLLECCYIKIILKNVTNRADREKLKHIMEPVAYHNILKNLPVPLVQWNTDHASIMMCEPFVLLIHKLGFQLPVEAGSLFVRIPDYWTPDTLYSLAKRLGPLDKLLIKFDVKDLEQPSNQAHPQADIIKNDMELTVLQEPAPLPEKSNANNMFAVPKAKDCNFLIREASDPFSPSPNPNWLQLVMRSKCSTDPLAAVAPAATENQENSDSASVASDLTRMYVSDEDEKHEYGAQNF